MEMCKAWQNIREFWILTVYLAQQVFFATVFLFMAITSGFMDSEGKKKKIEFHASAAGKKPGKQ